MRPNKFPRWTILPLAIALLALHSCEKLGKDSPTSVEATAENQALVKSPLPAVLTSPPDIIVNTTSDVSDFEGSQQVSDLPGADGFVSLREAITAANNTTGPQVIGFNIPTTDAGFDGRCFTIRPFSPLTIHTDGGTTTDGSSQAMHTGDTNPTGPEVVIDATLLALNGHEHAIRIHSPDNTIHCLVINGAGVIGQGGSNAGIAIWGDDASHNTITGCVIGLDPTGSHKVWTEGNGITLWPGADNTRIGGTTVRERNVIAGMSTFHAIGIGTSNNVIIGNFIGTDVTGTSSIPTCVGILIDGSNNNLIGRSLPGSGNVIACEAQGVKIIQQSVDNLIEGNLIGADVSGRSQLGTAEGVWVDPGPERTTIRKNLIASGGGHGIRYYAGEGVIRRNTIGTDINGRPGLGSAASGIAAPPEGDNRRPGHLLIEYNTIASSRWYGISVDGEATILKNKVLHNAEDGLQVGSAAPGLPYARILISQNEIFGNGGIGIDLSPLEGVTPNDLGDADEGPNNLMNYPVLESAKATPGKLIVKGYIDTPNPKTVIIEFFANPVPDPGGDPSGHGEGAVYLGSDRPNPQGKFTATLPTITPGTLITATATDADGNTSEFAANIEATAPGSH